MRRHGWEGDVLEDGRQEKLALQRGRQYYGCGCQCFAGRREVAALPNLKSLPPPPSLALYGPAGSCLSWYHPLPCRRRAT